MRQGLKGGLIRGLRRTIASLRSRAPCRPTAIVGVDTTGGILQTGILQMPISQT
jgi:hypothetical protein